MSGIRNQLCTEDGEKLPPGAVSVLFNVIELTAGVAKEVRMLCPNLLLGKVEALQIGTPAFPKPTLSPLPGYRAQLLPSSSRHRAE